MIGAEGAWFQQTRRRHDGHIEAGGMDKDVVFADADHALDDAIDEEYRRKYGRSSTAVDHITCPTARATTIRLVPS